MSKRHCCGQFMLNIFRWIQFALSLCSLACAIYITYTMHDLSSTAHSIRVVLEGLDADESAIAFLQSALVPVLRHFESKSVRSIIILLASIWSTGTILYLFYSNRLAQHSDHDLIRNSRKLRIMLSLFTLILWLIAFACAVFLVIEYGIFTITIGPESKTAVVVAKDAISVALQTAAAVSETVSDILDLISTMITIGGLAIVILVASSSCAMVELVSCMVACFVRGGSPQEGIVKQLDDNGEKGMYQIVVTPAVEHPQVDDGWSVYALRESAQSPTIPVEVKPKTRRIDIFRAGLKRQKASS